MHKQWVVTVVVLAILFGGLFGGKLYLDQRARAAMAHQSYPPTTVATAVAHAATWEPEVTVVGTLGAVSGTEITAQIAGNVTQIAFQSGTQVKQGDLLVRLDDSSEVAQLHADQAKLQLAQATLTRTRTLYQAHAASQLDLQTAQANYNVAHAAVEGDEATLRKLRITAPFSGTVGIREVSLGQYVSPGTAVVNLQSWNPLLLNFSLPQSSLSDLKPGRAVAFTVDAYPDRSFDGRITAISSQVDPATRNVALQATLDNAAGLLRPGLFGHARLSIGQTLRGVTVPSTALTYSTFGNNVYVVDHSAEHNGTAHAVIVQVQEERGGLTLIREGLKDGDVVVTAGQNKLRSGSPVVVDNRLQP